MCNEDSGWRMWRRIKGCQTLQWRTDTGCACAGREKRVQRPCVERERSSDDLSHRYHSCIQIEESQNLKQHCLTQQSRHSAHGILLRRPRRPFVQRLGPEDVALERTERLEREHRLHRVQAVAWSVGDRVAGAARAAAVAAASRCCTRSLRSRCVTLSR